MLKVGLTGGIASGKSFVGEVLQSCGCLVVRADELGHEALAPGGGAYDGVVREFGPQVLTPTGEIDRKQLAARVFSDPALLARLNAIVHPPVIRREEELMAEFAAREPQGIAVVEAAILIESGRAASFDRMILVFCSPEQQLERALRRDSAEEADIKLRLGRQMPLDQKRTYAHFVIDTSGDKEDAVRQTRAVYEELRRIAS